MRANQTLDARVYVGTYAKYNNGNIDGAWISLNSCDSYEDFLKKCATIHQDEADPEYMIQDCENMPDMTKLPILLEHKTGSIHFVDERLSVWSYLKKHYTRWAYIKDLIPEE
jgi:hypothetical protein